MEEGELTGAEHGPVMLTDAELADYEPFEGDGI